MRQVLAAVRAALAALVSRVRWVPRALGGAVTWVAETTWETVAGVAGGVAEAAEAVVTAPLSALGAVGAAVAGAGAGSAGAGGQASMATRAQGQDQAIADGRQLERLARTCLRAAGRISSGADPETSTAGLPRDIARWMRVLTPAELEAVASMDVSDVAGYISGHSPDKFLPSIADIDRIELQRSTPQRTIAERRAAREASRARREADEAPAATPGADVDFVSRLDDARARRAARPDASLGLAME